MVGNWFPGTKSQFITLPCGLTSFWLITARFVVVDQEPVRSLGSRLRTNVTESKLLDKRSDTRHSN